MQLLICSDNNPACRPGKIYFSLWKITSPTDFEEGNWGYTPRPDEAPIVSQGAI
jgi:hypothetical protein